MLARGALMATTIPAAHLKAIETRYAGCHFRSRLEARWAVAFDHLGIEWEYEAQGYEVTPRLSLGEETFHYLPDFWLPELNMWAEVKGTWTPAECDRFLNAAASIMDHRDGGNFVILPTIPRALEKTWKPCALHMHKGDLMVGPWDWTDRLHGCIEFECEDNWLAIARDVGPDRYRDCGMILEHLAGRIGLLRGATSTTTSEANDWTICDRFINAITAAKSARFEHGESGAT